MSSETNQDGATADTGAGEGKAQETQNEIRLAKAEYDELIGLKATVGSLKRQLKDFQKPKDDGQDTKETPQTKTEEFGLLQKTYLRAASITDEDEIELAKETSKKWGIDVDKLVDDEDFKIKLKKLRDAKANSIALDVKGGSAPSSGAKNTSQYWNQQGTPPTAKDVPDRKVRAKIVREMLDNQKNAGGKFYND